LGVHFFGFLTALEWKIEESRDKLCEIMRLKDRHLSLPS
jgi:hypothetical protein